MNRGYTSISTPFIRSQKPMMISKIMAGATKTMESREVMMISRYINPAILAAFCSDLPAVVDVVLVVFIFILIQEIYKGCL